MVCVLLTEISTQLRFSDAKACVKIIFPFSEFILQFDPFLFRAETKIFLDRVKYCYSLCSDLAKVCTGMSSPCGYPFCNGGSRGDIGNTSGTFSPQSPRSN
jgi:hypothetical protein